MSRILTAALVQLACTGNTTENFQRCLAGIRSAAERGARLIVLQELHNSLYFCQQESVGQFDLAETIPGPSTERLGALARELGVVIVASLFEKRASGLYHNTAVVLDSDGRIAGRYRKMHIPDDPGFYEKFYFTPGDLGFKPIDTSIGRLGILVCWDQWFPEGARLMALAGAELLVYPTAIGWDPQDAEDEKARQREAWITIQRSHAIANGLPMLSCNRMGLEEDPSGRSGGIQFWGSSFICGPQGEFLARAQETATTIEEIVVADIDLEQCERVRRIWPYLRDRRIDAYTDLTLRYRDLAPTEE